MELKSRETPPKTEVCARTECGFYLYDIKKIKFDMCAPLTASRLMAYFTLRNK